MPPVGSKETGYEMTQAERGDIHHKRSGIRYAVAWVIAVVVVSGTVAGLVFARQRDIAVQHAQLEAAEKNGPRVLVKQVKRSPHRREMDLPASLRGYTQTAIYAKTAGYLKTIRVDKGDRVRKGEVLAVLESPEMDKAVADAKANYWLKQRTDDRNQKLARLGVVAAQQADDSHAQMLQARAAYQQLLAMQRYETIRAPFDGVITARFYDEGALIPQATSPTSATPIVTMATLTPVRVYANVPQNVAPFVHDGDPATITVAEYPGRRFVGRVTRHPEAIDPSTLTMLVEVDLPNEDRALYPGMYGRMHLSIPIKDGAPMVPDDALIYRDNRIYVPVVRDRRLHLSEVTLGWDDGYNVEVIKGVEPGEFVALNAGQAAHEGELVQPVTATH